jgi:fructose-bisphosphate aldolase class II
MLDRAKEGGFAYPAINVTSSITVNAALRGFAEAGSDGILQASTGGAEFASGTKVKDMVTGAVALAEFTKVVADKYGITVALHTDHCPKDKLDTYVKPLIAISTERVKAGGLPLFQSHMWDGSAVPLDENLKIAGEKLYTSPDDFIATLDALGLPENNSYIVAATFGNVHGVYKPGGVKLRPGVLKDGQDALSAKLGLAAGSKPFSLVFHGGSGSSPEEIAEAVSYGVIKMNIDTDTQYAFTRPLADHFFKNYDGVLKVDGEVGNKKAYDPRGYNKLGEIAMADRIVEACQQLGSAGQSLSG